MRPGQASIKPTAEPRIYLDHAAAAPMMDEVLGMHDELARTWFVNPHGTSSYAENARQAVRGAERRLLRALDIDADDARVIWTSGGTEADNLACRGAPRPAGAGSVALVDAGAHAAMLESCRTRARESSTTTCTDIPLDRDGQLDLEAVTPPAKDGVFLVAACHVNNETGAVCETDRLRAWMDRNTPDALLVLDAIQALGKVRVPWDTPHVDLLCLSARKIGGPVSVGAVVCRRSLSLRPVLAGGDQQNGMRPGTLDVPGILEFAAAADIAATRRDRTAKHAAALNRILRDGLHAMTRWEPVLLSPENACPAICTVAFPGFEGAVLMRLLASRGVLVSAGSACHAESGRTSHVLKAMGIDERTARGALRISFGPGNTAEDVHDFLGELCTVMDEY